MIVADSILGVNKVCQVSKAVFRHVVWLYESIWIELQGQLAAS